MGMTGEMVIVGFLIFELTHSSAWVGVSLAFYFGPMLILGVLSGVIADRIDRRKLLPVTEFLITLVMGLFGLLYYFDQLGLWQLILITFISGSFRAIYRTLTASYLYDIVGGSNIVSSFGLMNLGTRIGQLLGASMSGIFVHRYGAGSAFFLLTIGHLVALLFLLRLTTVGRSAEAVAESIVHTIKDYWLEVRHNNALLVLIGLTAAVEIFGFSFVTALPELATSKLKVGVEGLGLMHSARACGGLLAGIALTGALNLHYKGRLYIFIVLGFGFGVLFLGLSPNLTLALLAVAAVATMAVSTDVLSQSMMQLVVPDKLRGRAMGAWVFAVGIAPIGHLQMGFLAQRVGVDTALVINGLALLLISSLVFFSSANILKQR